jgi:hypothetical protein
MVVKVVDCAASVKRTARPLREAAVAAMMVMEATARAERMLTERTKIAKAVAEISLPG